MANKVATREAYGKALQILGAENPNVVVLDADLSKSTKTADFAKKYPERFFNMGIAEANLLGTAAGLAAAGKIPFASTFAIFAVGRAFEQIRNSIAYPKLNVKIAATHSGITVGEDGGSHQAIEDVAIMRAVPNMVVLVPADGEETRQVVLAAAQYNGPVYIRMGRLDVPLLFDAEYQFEIGKANVLKEGTDVAIMANGVLVSMALEAASELADKGISVSVVNVASVKPLDEETIVQIAKTTGAVVTAEEHNIIGGLGSAIAEVLGEKQPTPMVRVGLKDTFGESGRPQELLEKYGLTKQELVKAVHEVLAKKQI
ncbi:transketolase family protein [Desulfosporosinus sp. BICA1-9]|uniref:transketolase family protein n=1 Tax=Desulfosporosinus sp. BICA1-9 TaxID=1531958 RepID=UPI00054B622A|nr:transketolase family protein [Desulfosporosinus sp. BICA1-9]KJS50807.1 MAG: transketolase [Peptococcaceae bacterium BRH_c23]KJS89561.1 MAG: transketolase [Desulfosporosinus sp. BICA1-9]HBW36633.1 transketolase family protein [Desulfosporosinus sp.]